LTDDSFSFHINKRQNNFIIWNLERGMSWNARSRLPDPNDAERARTRAIRCLREEVAPIVLLPGDPFRAAMIGETILEDGRLVMINREFHTYTGAYRGTRVSVISTGLGSPGAAMVVRDLATLGVRAAIRIGTAGSGQERVRPGDLVIATGAVRDEGVTRHYAVPGFPAVPDPELTEALVGACRTAGFARFHRGIVHTSDAFQSPVTAAELGQLTGLGVLAYEMEAAAVMVTGAMCGLPTACILAIDGLVANVQSGDHVPDFNARDRAVRSMIEIALTASAAYANERLGPSGRLPGE
jgi:DeoD family purine-nucleoside phosphorylase